MVPEKFINVFIETKEELAENLVAVLSQFPILGVEERNDVLVVTFRKTDWAFLEYDFFVECLKLVDKDAKISRIDVINEKNWNEEWEMNLTPVTVTDNIAIVPSTKVNSTGKQIELIIDPKMSFGTGHHSTTKIMIRLAEKYVRPESFWIDVGTGTGILAILAKKLGAKEVLALDNNIWAIENATENILKNGIKEGIDLVELDVDTHIFLPVADGIFANLNYDLIVRSLRKFYSSVVSTQGVVLVSGILLYDYDEFVQNITNNFEMVEVLREDEWFGAVLTPKY